MTRMWTMIAVLLFVACPAFGQETAEAPGGLSEDQLENLVSPVALYPDALLDQILEASQYPSALVAAGDFVSHSTDGQQPDPSWPPSVTALLKYPSVLSSLDDKLAWTTRLGNAVKAQRAGVESAVQAVRQKAQAAGNLVSDDRQKVVEENNSINIVPANPQVVCVPEYDPSLIYSPWPYYGTPFVTYGGGFAAGAAAAHDWDWYRHRDWDWYHHHYYDHHHHGHHDHPRPGPHPGPHPHPGPYYGGHPYHGYHPAHYAYHPHYSYHPHYGYHPRSFHGGGHHGGFHGGGAHFHGGGGHRGGFHGGGHRR